MALWPFGKKASSPPTFMFSDDQLGRDAFFKLQCKYGDTRIERGKGMVALVLDASREFPGIPTPVKIEPDGSQLAVLKVVSEDGGFVVVAKTPSSSGDRLVPGDFVAWVPQEQLVADQLGSDKRLGWVGLIRAKIDWKNVGSSGSFGISSRFD